MAEPAAHSSVLYAASKLIALRCASDNAVRVSPGGLPFARILGFSVRREAPATRPTSTPHAPSLKTTLSKIK